MNDDMNKVLAESPLARLDPILDGFLETIADFFNTHLFGILALILWVRVVMTILNGRTSALLIVLAILSSLIAVAQGQALW